MSGLSESGRSLLNHLVGAGEEPPEVDTLEIEEFVPKKDIDELYLPSILS